MLGCNACIRKCIRVVLADVLGISQPLIKIYPLPPPWSSSRRCFASDAAEVQDKFSKDRHALLPHYTHHKQKAVIQCLAFKETDLQQELRYLRDPVKLADHVLMLLRQDDFAKAHELVKISSRNVPCVVSWNHLIDYVLSKGQIRKAINLYNDMKKRALVPDAQTFTILFRGLAMHPDKEPTMTRALSIYRSMYDDKSPVKPSIIHTNALLTVCARALDIDALFSIAAKLPMRGAAAPNKLTYTIIMNAIRADALTDYEEQSGAQIAKQHEAVSRGRRMWGDMIGRWTTGDILIDEEMVCSMGRLLLLGNTTRDCDDVFSLIQQTMGVSRQLPRGDYSGYFNRPAGMKKDRRLEQEKNISPNKSTAKDSDSVTEFERDGQLSPNNFLTDESGAEFDPISAHESAFARPGCNTLSMVMDACVELHAFQPAHYYWNLFVSPSGRYNIAPDGDNYHMYLRLLRIQRASKSCLEVVQEMRHTRQSGGSVLQIKSFRIALGACNRDSNNPNVLDHAGKLVQIMLDMLDAPDISALGIYLDLAKHPRQRDWRNIMGVLKGSALGVHSLRNILDSGKVNPHFQGMDEASTAEAKKEQRRKEEEMSVLGGKLIGASDVALALGSEQMSAEDKLFLQKQKKSWTAWITKRMNRTKALEAKTNADRTRQKPFTPRPRNTSTADPRSAWTRRSASASAHQKKTPPLSNDGITPRASTHMNDDDPKRPGGKWKPFLGGSFRPSEIHSRWESRGRMGGNQGR